MGGALRARTRLASFRGPTRDQPRPARHLIQPRRLGHLPQRPCHPSSFNPRLSLDARASALAPPQPVDRYLYFHRLDPGLSVTHIFPLLSLLFPPPIPRLRPLL